MNVLTIDPPWPYTARATDTTHRARSPYLTMTNF
jgi:N6-adenosine-specific RNA methylase IME4